MALSRRLASRLLARGATESPVGETRASARQAPAGSAPGPAPSSPDLSRRQALAGLALAALIILLSHAPALPSYFVSDDFDWLNAGFEAYDRPLSLLTPLEGFYRPLARLLFFLVWNVAGPEPWPYHLAIVFIHLVNFALVYRLGAKLGGSRAQGLAAAVLWGATSRISDVTLGLTPVFDALLLVTLLALVLALPAAGTPLTGRRVAALVLLEFPAALAKETWIVAPALLFALVFLFHRDSLARMARNLALLAVVPVVYFLALSWLHPTFQWSYYRWTPAALLHPLENIAGWLGFDRRETGLAGPAIGAVFLALVLWALFRSRFRLGLAGAAWFVLLSLPTMAVPVQPNRYLYAPSVGLAWLAVPLAAAGYEILARRSARWARAGAVAALAGYAALHAAWLQVEIADVRLLGLAHREVVREYEAVRPAIDPAGVVVFVERSSVNRLERLLPMFQGPPRYLFVRGRDPARMVDFPSLVNFAGDPRRNRFVAATAGDVVAAYDAGHAQLLWHGDEGFFLDPSSLPALAERIRAEGRLPEGFQAGRFAGFGGAAH